MNELSAYELERFRICTEKIDTGFQTCFEVGLALTEIRDNKLYREDFRTFEEFTTRRYSIGSAHAHRLITALEIKNSPIGANIANEAQARAIAKVPEERRAEVMDMVVSNGEVTAAAIESASQAAEHDCDELGKTIPDSIKPLWDKAYAESRDMLFLISDLRGKFKRGRDLKNPVFAEIRFSENIGLLDTLYANVKLICPHGLCPKCAHLEAKPVAVCELCKGRGFLSQFAFKMFGNV